MKSLGGIQVKHASVLGKGLQYDRRYMLIDENNKFITQRAVHELSLFKLSFAENGFLISFNDDSIQVPFIPSNDTEPKSVTLWDDTLEACELGNEYNLWFSRHLGIKCSLVYFPEENTRQVDVNFASHNEQVSLADGYPFLIIGQRSLDDLNSKLNTPVPMNRFRPNFVFEGGTPYEEDEWKEFTIGSSRFRGVKLCARCVLTTINQDTGISGIEPLATLSSYRKEDGKVHFGKNLLALNQEKVSQGDIIIVESN